MRLLKLLVVVAALVLTPLAFADTTFYFSGYASPTQNPGYTGINIVGSFTATPDVNAGVWDITSATGWVFSDTPANQFSIASVPPLNYTAVTNANGFLYDDLYYSSTFTAPGFAQQATADGFDYWGLLLETVGGTYVNLFENGGPVYADTAGAYTNNAYFTKVADIKYDTVVGTSPNVEYSLAPAPEPSSLMLLGTGALGMALTVRRRMAAKIK